MAHERGTKKVAPGLRRIGLGTSALVGMALLAAFLIQAQPTSRSSSAGPSPIERIQSLVAEATETIGGWEQRATVCLVLAAIVIAFGLISAAMLGSGGKLVKIVRVLLGVFVSLITFLSDTMYPEGYRTLKDRASVAKSYVRKIEFRLADYDAAAPADIRQEWRDEIHSLLEKIYDLERTGIEVSSLPDLSMIAYAQTREPDRISTPPQNQEGLYFVGIFSSDSLKQAKDESANNAVELAVEHISKGVSLPGLTNTALNDYVRKSSQIEDSYLTFDRQTKSVRYFTLLRLNKKFADRRAVEIFGGGTLTAGNTATQVRPGWWRWTTYVSGPDELLDEIECVEYTLHRTFPEPVRKVCKRGDGLFAFPLTTEGWGTFEIPIRVTRKDGQEVELSHQLRFDAVGDCRQIDEFTLSQRTLFRLAATDFQRSVYVYVGDIDKGKPTNVHVLASTQTFWRPGRLSENDFRDRLGRLRVQRHWRFDARGVGDDITFDFSGKRYRLIVTGVTLQSPEDQIRLKICPG